MITASRVPALGVVAVLTGLVAGCTGGPAGAPVADSLTVGVTAFSEPDGDGDYANVLFLGPVQAAYEGLVFWDPVTAQIEPLLAEEIEISDDKKTMTLKLREDVDFTDGAHLDAEGVVAFFEYTFNRPGTIASVLPELVPPPEVEAIDEYTVEFHATDIQPFNYDFLTSFSIVPIISPDSIPAEGEEIDGYPAGTGPYVFEELEQEVSVTMTRNPDYWNPDAYPYDTIVFQAFADQVAALNALKSGQIDATAIESATAAEAENSGFRVSEGSGVVMTLVIEDRDGKIQPALADRRVREAMNLAFDREGIRDNIEAGYGSISSQPFFDYQPFYVDGADDDYGYDLDRARDLMADAGYEDGFAITMPSYPGWSSAPYEPIITQSLADIGITVTWEPLADGIAYIAAMEAGTYPVLANKEFSVNLVKYFKQGRWGPDVDPELLDLIEVFYTGTTQESDQAAEDIGHFLLDEVWFMPISQPKLLWASVPEVAVQVGGTVGLPHVSGFGPAA